MTKDNKIALVTGGNRGIGFEICRQLGRDGFLVILTARDKQKGSDAAGILQEGGLNVHFEPLEIGNEASTFTLAEMLTKKYDKVDVLVNNAGILPNGNNIEIVAIDEVKQVFNTNFFGAYCWCSLFCHYSKNQSMGV